MSKEINKEQQEIIKKYIEEQSCKVVKEINWKKKSVKYVKELKGKPRKPGDEEITRAYLLTKLVNEHGYKIENIEIEHEYTAGRPNTNTCRIDIAVKYEESDDKFLFIEVKSPQEFEEEDKDTMIEEQLYKVSAIEEAEGNKVKYLTLYTIDIENSKILDNATIIDKEKFPIFNNWKEIRDYTDEFPIRYGKPQKTPYIKGEKKDLEKEFSEETFRRIKNDLHNKLWAGGSTDDNEIFSSLTNILLAKIQDEDETEEGEAYKFQCYTFKKDDDKFESLEDLYVRINNLYKRALKNRLNIEEDRIKEASVIQKSKFSLQKLKYTVQQLEKYSFIEGKNSLTGKDILGEFFESIIRDGFKQTKGQFFTPLNIVTFMLYAIQTDKLAINKINKEYTLPYFIDCSAGSGTFLIEYMKFITKNIKNTFRKQVSKSSIVKSKMDDWFYPDDRENRWAMQYIYGADLNFNLGTAIKVNMILHGDGSSNIFVGDPQGDGLLSFDRYVLNGENTILTKSSIDKNYGKIVNEQFDLILTNPPFSIDLADEAKENIKNNFLFGNKKNSENLFIERYYQLLKEKGRLGVILPESIFDTSENKYIRLFLYKYFTIKAIVSLPQITFQPYTSTKTSILFAEKKSEENIEKWNKKWNNYAKKYAKLKTRVENIIKVIKKEKEQEKLPSIKDMSESQMKKQILYMLKDDIEENDELLELENLIEKYEEELNECCKIDKDTIKEFGHVNTRWVFARLSEEIKDTILMAEVDNIGYKRTLKSYKITPNELYRVDNNGDVIVDDGKKETVLDFMREIEWSE